MLTRQAILAEIAAGRITIEPFDPASCGPNSVDLRLSDRLLVYGDEEDARRLSSPKVCIADGYGEYHITAPSRGYSRVLDMKRDNRTAEIVIPPEGLVLLPGELYLGATLERIGSSHFVPAVETRSSVARLGCSSHLSAGFCDLGFCGAVTLEITVAQPLRVHAGCRFCQVAFHEPSGGIELYEGKYGSQKGPTSSKMWRDWAP